jgi:hypothetical protein
MFQDFSFPKPTPWLYRIWQDLQPTPERLSKALRMTLSSLLVLVLMLVLQMPYIAYGLYFIFLIGRESPSVSLRTAFASVVTILLVIVSEMGVVILSDNDPMARVLSVVIVTFVGGMILVSTSLPSLGSIAGFIYCVVIGFWEHHATEDTLVKNSLRLLAAFAMAAACGVAVEYVFGSRSPADRLEEQFRIRYQALLLTLHKDGVAFRCRHLRLVSIVVFGGRDLRIKRHVKIVIEIAAKRGNPRDAPSFLRFIGVELGQRCPGNHDERRVAVLQQRQIAQRVYQTRAACAPLIPCWVEHEVIDDELAATLEEVFETLFAVRPVEDIVLFDLHHGKPASCGIHVVVVLGEFLFICQKFLPLGEPLVSRNDWRMWDRACCHLWACCHLYGLSFDPVREVWS